MTKKQKELFEKLAEIEHQRWADWQKYLHSKMETEILTRTIDFGNGDPAIIKYKVLPKELYDRWQKQIKTPYSELTEKEKDSDREQVMRYWDLINNL